VRYRLATRSALADRNANLIVPPGAPFLARYCIENAAPATCKKFARVRTIVSEVAAHEPAGDEPTDDDHPSSRLLLARRAREPTAQRPARRCSSSRWTLGLLA